MIRRQPQPCAVDAPERLAEGDHRGNLPSSPGSASAARCVADAIDNSKLKSLGDARPDGDGIYAVNSPDIRIGAGADCPNNQPCNDLTYDDGFGLDLVDTHDVVINAATVSANDTGGYLLDGSNTYHVTLQNSHASGLGPICTTTTINNQKENTGYLTDLRGALMLVNGAHDNTFSGDTFNIPASAPMPSIGSRSAQRRRAPGRTTRSAMSATPCPPTIRACHRRRRTAPGASRACERRGGCGSAPRRGCSARPRRR